MEPITPVVPGMRLPVTVFAKDQPQYRPLPAFRDIDGAVVTRWRMNWRERLCVLLHGDIWLSVLTFGAPLQPVKLEVSPPLKPNRQGNNQEADE